MTDRPTLDAAEADLNALERRVATDPLGRFELTDPQRQFVTATEKEVWFAAANRSGKTDGLSAVISSFARFGNPDPTTVYLEGGQLEVTDRSVSIWAVSLTNEMSRTILQPKLFDNGFLVPGAEHDPFIPPYEIASWHQAFGLLTLKNGSIIAFKSGEQGRRSFQGAGKNLIGFDEVPDKSIYDESTLRISAGRPLLIRGAATLLPPEGLVGGVSWLYREKIVPFLTGQVEGLRCIAASIYSNPHLLPQELRALEDRFPEGTLERRIRLDGEWLPGLAGTRAYPVFDQRLHVRAGLALDPKRPLLWSLDFNVAPMGTIVAQIQGSTLVVLGEITVEQGSIPGACEAWMRRYPRHQALLAVHGDAKGMTRHHQTGQTDYLLILEQLRRLPYPVELRVPATNPFERDRINAVNRKLRGPFGEAEVAIAEGQCPDLVTDLEDVLLDRHGGVKKTENPRDPYFRRTSWTDALGYLTAWYFPVAASITPDRPTRRRIGAPSYTFTGENAPGRPPWRRPTPS